MAEVIDRAALRRRRLDKANAQKLRWAKNNPEKAAAINDRRKPKKKRYYQDHKDEYAARSLKWRTDNRERWNEISRTNIARNPQRNADLSARRRARERGVETEKVDRIAIYRCDDGICHLCGKPVSVDSFTLDHVIPIVKGGPHKASNLKVAHKSCNSSKRDRLLSEIGDNHA